MKKWIRKITCIVVIFGLISGACLSTGAAEKSTEEDSFWVEFADVGQGDCAIIQCDGHYMMIDGGPAAASGTVYSILKEKKIKNLDYMIATHPDADHIGGLSGALNYADTAVCFSPVKEYDTKTFSNLTRYLKKQGIGITIPAVGESYKLGSAEVDILGPVSSFFTDTNDDSIVVKVTYGDTSFLFMGDAESSEEYSMIKSGEDLSCDVLKVGHHGSSTSTTSALLAKACPKYAVISVGADNTYGHPTETTLQKLKSRKIVIYRTDLQGDIVFYSDGQDLDIRVSKQPGDDDTSDSTSSIPEGTTYILNVNSMVFHLPDCDSVADMAERNKIYSDETSEAIMADGYRPCHRCRPDKTHG